MSESSKHSPPPFSLSNLHSFLVMMPAAVQSQPQRPEHEKHGPCLPRLGSPCSFICSPQKTLFICRGPPVPYLGIPLLLLLVRSIVSCFLVAGHKRHASSSPCTHSYPPTHFLLKFPLPSRAGRALKDHRPSGTLCSVALTAFPNGTSALSLSCLQSALSPGPASRKCHLVHTSSHTHWQSGFCPCFSSNTAQAN